MLQKPKIILPSKDQIRTLENRSDNFAWHISWVDVKAPRNEMAIEAANMVLFHCG
jgi:hypothetical protein